MVDSTDGCGPPAAGWFHATDSTHCVAGSLVHFGRSARDRIELSGTGILQLGREFAADKLAPPPGPKALTFYRHFVGIPVHIGAATSPQSMMAPHPIEAVMP